MLWIKSDPLFHLGLSFLLPVCEDKVHPDLSATIYSLDVCISVYDPAFLLAAHNQLCTRICVFMCRCTTIITVSISASLTNTVTAVKLSKYQAWLLTALSL